MLSGGSTALALIAVTGAGAWPDPWGRPLGTDFSSFWTAAGLARDGAAAAAWDLPAHAAAQHARFTAEAGYAVDYYAFFYPPPFLLLCLPLALLPYGPAMLAWLAATGWAYLAVMRRLMPKQWPALLAASAFPAVLLNAEHGQNGMMTTALVGAAATMLDRRPRAAGACLGALCCKPQLALLVVPMLVGARRWVALGWAAASAAGLALASLLVLGGAAWRGFLASVPIARMALAEGLVGFAKMASPFAAMRLLGAAPALAGAIQLAISLAAAIVALSVARRRPGAAAEMATLAVAACLATPFLLDYDLLLLAIPLAWIAAVAACDGYRPWEKLTLAAAFLLPLLVRPLAHNTGLPAAPLVVTGLLAVVVRRAWRPMLLQGA